MNKKRIGRAAAVVILRVLILIVRILPLPVALAVGRGLGSLMRRLSKKRYRVALKNLRIAFGDTLSEQERERIARESFRHFGMFAVESIKFAYISQAEVERRIEIKQFHQLEETLAQGKGALLITGHLGNFEIAARYLAARGLELIALAREARDRGTTGIMLAMRERMGIRVVTLKQSLRPVMEGLKRNACVAIICDQNAADVFVPFFGHPTGTVDGPARFALRTGAPMVFFYCVRDGKGHYQVGDEGIYWPESTGDMKADVERVTAEMNRRLEAMIRKHPEQWLWFHDRWKSSPAVNQE